MKPHKTFKRDGVNLYMDMPISFCQAALGCELEVPTLDGKVKYTIPAERSRVRYSACGTRASNTCGRIGMAISM